MLMMERFRRGVRVVHRFHPWLGREFEFVQRRRTWDVDRVFFRVPGAGVVSLPAGWSRLILVCPPSSRCAPRRC